MHTPRKYSEAFNISNNNIYDKNRLIQTQSNHHKYASSIGMFNPNIPIFNKTITTYQITPTYKLNSKIGLYQQFYDRNGKNNTNVKTQDTFNIQESNVNRMSATYSFNSSNQKSNNFNDFYYQKRGSRTATPSQQSYAQQNSQHQIIDNNGNRYSNSYYKYMQNQSYVSDIDRSRKSNSVGKRGKFLTVVSRMPACKKPIHVHNF